MIAMDMMTTLPNQELAPVKLHPEVLTFLMMEFIAIKVRPGSENTRRSYLEDLRKLGEFTMGDLSDQKLLAFKIKVIDRDRDGNARSARTSNHILSVCRKFLRFLMEKHILARNYFDLIDGAKVDKMDSPYVALTDMQVRAMINYPDRNTILGSSQRLALILGFYLCLRREEICSIRHKHLVNGVLSVKGKGNKLRHIPVPEQVLEEIDGYIGILGLHRETIDPEMFLIQSRESHGGRVHPCTVHRWYVGIAKACNIEEHVSPHTARATGITKSLDNGIGIRDVSILAGHSSVETTAIYDKRRGTASKAAVNAIRY